MFHPHKIGLKVAGLMLILPLLLMISPGISEQDTLASLPPTPEPLAPPAIGSGGGSGSGGVRPHIFARYNGEEVNVTNQIPAGGITSFDLEFHEPGVY